MIKKQEVFLAKKKAVQYMNPGRNKPSKSSNGGWRHGSSGRACAQQVWSPEFKPQHCQKSKMKQTKK
jgi:hypothetical protein